jgi:uncharacterized protein (DUF305 family)
MRLLSPHLGAVALFSVLVGTACSSVTTQPAGQPTPTPAATVPPPLQRPFTQADVDFMAGMIPHHAQALKMSALVPTRSQHPQVRILAERISIGQKDEIEMLRHWLGDRNLPVPPADATHHRMNHGGTMHEMLMPGMLTDEELKQLENATGTAFDRLFLQFMIRHHAGAVEMVDVLFKSNGAANDDMVYKFASDVFADQSSEIDRMQRLLDSLPAR